MPRAKVFKPAGVPSCELNWVEMEMDEYEAIRLVDGDGMDQEAAAGLLGVSRPTVSRILARGRAKLAAMLVSGDALVIEGGPVALEHDAPCGRHGRRGWRHGGRRG